MHMEGLTASIFIVVYYIANLITTFVLVGAVFKYEHEFSFRRRWLMGAAAASMLFNAIGFFFPSSPFMPWSLILSKLLMMALFIDLFGVYIPWGPLKYWRQHHE